MTVSNIQGKMVASHNGNGYWTVLADGQVLVNVVPVGFEGDLGVFADVPTFTTVEARDLTRVLTVAIDGIIAGGWQRADSMPDGVRVVDLVSQAEAILDQDDNQ